MKPTPTTPATAPSSAYRPYSQPDTRWKAGRLRNACEPKAARPTTLAATEASTTTPKDSAAKSWRMSSRAKKTPAMGALKVAEIPPAAPHATRMRSRVSGTLAS